MCSVGLLVKWQMVSGKDDVLPGPDWLGLGYSNGEKMRKPDSKSKRWVIVGNGSYGLWFGQAIDSDSKIISDKAVRLYRARNIRRWYGKIGGITSLAAFGPCGPEAQKSRIGAEINSTLILDVKAVHDCSLEAVAAFSAIVVL